jgi:hypothetical protein
MPADMDGADPLVPAKVGPDHDVLGNWHSPGVLITDVVTKWSRLWAAVSG